MDLDGGQPASESTTAPGLTPAERYLSELCRRNFLSLWSHARPFRDQGRGKELCDLLVVMGDDVIIFSDKHCELSPKSSLNLDWQRWFRSAVAAAAKQAWGAERWLREFPTRVFADEACSRPLPIAIPPPQTARYHLVVTVHGVAAASAAMLGGSGSLLLDTRLQGLESHSEPFTIGDLDPSRTFVHVFDDATLDIVMQMLTTVPDFLRYLREKERLCRSREVVVQGEENLLAHYLTHIDDDGEHALPSTSNEGPFALDDTWWSHFASSKERASQFEQDRCSYVWDHIVEEFISAVLTDDEGGATAPIEDSEIVLRFLASESRFRRRVLGRSLLEAMAQTGPDERRIRVVPSQRASEPMYVFLVFPWTDARTDEENRWLRREYLDRCISVARMKYRTADHVVGLATESGGTARKLRSHDALYLDARNWATRDDDEAVRLQLELNILVDETIYTEHILEYPIATDSRRSRASRKPGRNELCPCGSGRKYKRCHGSK